MGSGCEHEIQRDVDVERVTIASGAALSDAFDMRPYSGGVLQMPAAWTAAYIGFKVYHEATGTYLPLYDDNGALVLIGDTDGPTQPTADNAYALPPALFGAHLVKLWSQDGAGVDANQGADADFVIALKG